MCAKLRAKAREETIKQSQKDLYKKHCPKRNEIVIKKFILNFKTISASGARKLFRISQL